MLLRDAMVVQGNWLFRRRGYLPLILVPVGIIAAFESGSIERFLGNGLKDWVEVVAKMVAYLGLCIRIMAIGYAAPGTSGRNTSAQRAHSLNTTGLYSVVRNPLYLGNFMIIIGLAMLTVVWWFVALVAAVFFIYYERIIYAEEEFLDGKFGDEYRQWASRTPVFIPNPFLWRPSATKFSIRKALRHEYSGLFVIVAFSTFIDMVCDLLGERETFATWVREDQAWIVYFVLGLMVYLTLRHLKRHTKLLALPKSLG